MQTGLSWGLKRFLPENEDSLRNIYAVVEGLRHGYSALLATIPSFLERHIKFVRSDLGEEAVRSFWQALDLPPEVVP